MESDRLCDIYYKDVLSFFSRREMSTARRISHEYNFTIESLAAKSLSQRYVITSFGLRTVGLHLSPLKSTVCCG